MACVKVRQLRVGRHELGFKQGECWEVQYLDSPNQGFCICNVGIITSLGEQSKGWNENL